MNKRSAAEGTETKPSNFRLTLLARELLQRLAAEQGLTITAYLEMMSRRLARESGWDVGEIEAKLKVSGSGA